MIDDLRLLAQLQKIDLRIHELEKSKEEFPKEVEELEGRIETAQNTITTIDQKSEDVDKQEAQLEEKIQNARKTLERSQERLNTITTNREYDAVHSEIAAQESAIASSSSRRANFEEDKANLTKAREEALKELETISGENEPKIQVLQKRISSIDSDIAEVIKERDEIAPKIRPAYLRTYEHIHKRRKNGIAVGIVNDQSRTCPMCYKVLERQLVSEIRRGNRLEICQSCGTILIWEKEESQD
jgi:uncharacterized protein